MQDIAITEFTSEIITSWIIRVFIQENKIYKHSHYKIYIWNNNKQIKKNSCFRQETRYSERCHKKWNKTDFTRVTCGAYVEPEP